MPLQSLTLDATALTIDNTVANSGDTNPETGALYKSRSADRQRSRTSSMEEGTERRNSLTGMLENIPSSRASAVQDSTALFQAKDAVTSAALASASASTSASATGRAADEVVVYVRDVHYHSYGNRSTAYRYCRPRLRNKSSLSPLVCPVPQIETPPTGTTQPLALLSIQPVRDQH